MENYLVTVKAKLFTVYRTVQATSASEAAKVLENEGYKVASVEVANFED